MIRVDPDRLREFASALLGAGGMEAEKAGVTARILVEGDMIGHETHGVSLLPWYMDEMRAGILRGSGTHDVVNDRGACFVWRGNALPGAWLIDRALEQACERVRDHGIVAAAISDSHHTCALSAYLRGVAERGLIARISTSNPAAGRMAPFGGTEPLLTPNPSGTGFPTRGDPIMVDISSSITTTTMTRNLARAGQRYPEEWAQTADGTPTDDPREVTERGGSLLPLGGRLKGHKGYGLALVEELLGQGLSGRGRANVPQGPLSQCVFLQVIDPEAFAGLDAFAEQSEFLARACRANRPAAGAAEPVRVPGDAAARKRREALARGVPLDPEVAALLDRTAGTYGLAPVPR